MRVLLFLLKCLVGIFATIGFLLVLAAVLVSFSWRELENWRAQPQLPASMVLTLDLSDGVIERRPATPLALAKFDSGIPLITMYDVLEAAAEDPAVKGLVLKAGAGPLTLARAQEIREALQVFRDSGKPTMAFAETFGEAGNGTLHYYLASVMEDVWVQPSGDVDLVGYRLEQPFLNALLTEYGIVPTFGQREEFKAAVDALTQDSMPEPVRENLQDLIDSWLSQTVRGISESRGLTLDRVSDLVNGAPHLAEAALDNGLVDRLGYWDELVEGLHVRMGDDVELVEFMDYESGREKPAPPAGAPVIAVIYGLGPVVLGDGKNDPFVERAFMSSNEVRQAFITAIEDEDVRAIVFRVDSPGGSYVASDTIWREVKRARELGKPVVVSMGSVAASGGYFVSAPADRIIAAPGTVTGSIGVVTGKVVLEELWQDLEITWDGVQAGDNAGMYSANRDFTEAQWARLQDSLDAIYEDFTGKVAEGRKLSPEDVEAVAGGRVWTGADAFANGLVDELGGYPEAIKAARSEAEIAPDAEVWVRQLPERRDPFSEILRQFTGGGAKDSATLAMAARLLRALQALSPLIEASEALVADPREDRLRLRLGEASELSGRD